MTKSSCHPKLQGEGSFYLSVPDTEWLSDFLFTDGKHLVGDNAKDKRTCNLGDLDGTEVYHESTDTCDEDNGNGEEVGVVVKVNLLDHLKTGYCDESVKCDTYSAHYT